MFIPLEPVRDGLLVMAAKGALLLGAAGVVTLALRRGTPAMRHLVWAIALGGALFLPVLGTLLPAWRVPVMRLEARMDVPPAIEVWASADIAGAPVAADIAVAGALDAAPAMAMEFVAVNTSAAEAEAAVIAEAAAPAFAAASADVMGFALSEPAWLDAMSARLLLVWLTGTLLVAVSLAVGVLRTRVTACAARPVDDDELQALTDRLSREMGIARRVRILEGDAAMPMTWGVIWPTILLPTEARYWPLRQRRDVLLHELAHIRRHDYLMQLVAWCACAVHWFNPLAWLAFARLRAEQELASDDAVLATGSRPSDYASHLVEVARSLRPATGAAVAMARPSALGRRVAALLDGRLRHGAPRHARAVVAGAALLLVLPLAAAEPGARVDLLPDEAPDMVMVRDAVAPDDGPGGGVVAVAGGGMDRRADVLAVVARQGRCDWNVRGGRSSTSTNITGEGHGKRLTITMSRGDCSLDVRVRGEMRLTDDERDVASLSAGGSLIVEEENGDSRRRIELRPGRSDQLDRHWLVDGREQPYDAAARAWLAQLLPTVLRRAGVDVEARVGRMLRRGGVDSVLREVELLDSDYLQGKYLRTVLDSARLSATDLRRVTRAVTGIGSDYEKARVLMAMAERQPLDDNLRVAFVQASATIGSDYERARVLLVALGRERLDDGAAVALLESVSGIGSDYERARVLVQFAENTPMSERVRPAYVAAVSGIGSDFERRRVLAAVLRTNRLEPAMVSDVLGLAEGMGSDYEKAQVLMLVLDRQALQGTVRDRFLRATQGVGSDHERNRVLAAYARRVL